MTIGTEHEFSINDLQFTPLPVSDQVIRSICGSYKSEILFGDIRLGKELQKTVLEMVPRTCADEIAVLEGQLVRGIHKFSTMFRDRYQLLGLGMHPTLTLGQTAVWDHDEGEYYEVYNRLFALRQHGWLNIQALQINLSYAGEKELVAHYNRLRSLLPFLIAVTASSPMVESSLRPAEDNRLLFYRENQKEIPAICHGIIPEPIRSIRQYTDSLASVYADLRSQDAGILCEEWVNSAGIIIRFSRKCIEIKALDEQDCIRSDMAVCAFVRSLLRCRSLSLEKDQDALLALAEEAIQHGTAGLLPELAHLYRLAWDNATPEERLYLPVVRNRIEHGSLAQRIRERYERERDIFPILSDMAMSLKTNRPYEVG
jgi:glutamate---cysteine ligase / carboxylate-amine ligase